MDALARSKGGAFASAPDDLGANGPSIDVTLAPNGSFAATSYGHSVRAPRAISSVSEATLPVSVRAAL
jgi:hypothetical protein